MEPEWIRGAALEYHRLSNFWIEVQPTSDVSTAVRFTNDDWDFDPISTW
jgi:hypothetical protein